MKHLNNIELINELKQLRIALTPTFNLKTLKLLDEIAYRMMDDAEHKGIATYFKEKKPQQGRRITKKDRMRKYL